MRSSRSAFAAVAAVAVACLPSAAGAAPPGPAGFDVTVPAGDFCDFAVHILVAGKAKTIDLGDRFVVTAPGQTLTATNLATGKVLTTSITGAFHNTTLADKSVETMATGRNLLGDPIAGLVIAVGDFSFTTAADGQTNIVPLHGEGRLIDVCAALT